MITGVAGAGGQLKLLPATPPPQDGGRRHAGAGVRKRYTTLLDWLHGFYAPHSIQIDLTASMDAVSVVA